jgi:hypothetical protein
MSSYQTVSLAGVPAVKAWIEVTPINGYIQVIPYCRSENAITVSYVLLSEKAGRSGTSRSRQSGKVVLESGKDTSLARQRLGVMKEDQYRLTLKVFSKGELIASDLVNVTGR